MRHFTASAILKV